MNSETGKNTGQKGENTAPSTGGSHDDEARNLYEQATLACRNLIRRGLKAALATFDTDPKIKKPTPYASLVITGTTTEGAPTLLISNLARHTKNLAANERASLLFDETGPTGDLSTSARVTVIGSLKPTDDQNIARRFISRHPDAAGYAAFADFSFYSMSVESAHYVGGFGRIVDVEGSHLLTGLQDSQSLIAAEPEIIEHMNQDYAETLALYATKILGAETQGGPWRMCGIDPDGIDILGHACALRLEFDSRVTTPQEARSLFKELAAKARNIT